jgi:hypothetical protein
VTQHASLRRILHLSARCTTQGTQMWVRQSVPGTVPPCWGGVQGRTDPGPPRTQRGLPVRFKRKVSGRFHQSGRQRGTKFLRCPKRCNIALLRQRPALESLSFAMGVRWRTDKTGYPGLICWKLLVVGWGSTMNKHSIPPIRRRAADLLRRARKLPVGHDRNDLRQSAIGLLWLEKRGYLAIPQDLTSHDAPAGSASSPHSGTEAHPASPPTDR